MKGLSSSGGSSTMSRLMAATAKAAINAQTRPRHAHSVGGKIDDKKAEAMWCEPIIKEIEALRLASSKDEDNPTSSALAAQLQHILQLLKLPTTPKEFDTTKQSIKSLDKKVSEQLESLLTDYEIFKQDREQHGQYLIKLIKSGVIDETKILLFLRVCTNINIDAVDANGESALHWAVRRGFFCEKVVQALLDRNPNIHLKNSNGETPYGMRERSSEEVRRILEEKLKKSPPPEAWTIVEAEDKYGDAKLSSAKTSRNPTTTAVATSKSNANPPLPTLALPQSAATRLADSKTNTSKKLTLEEGIAQLKAMVGNLDAKRPTIGFELSQLTELALLLQGIELNTNSTNTSDANTAVLRIG